MPMSKNAGFTMIELVIALSIAAILSAVAAPIYRDYTLEAKMAEVVTAFGAVKAQIAAETQMKSTMPQMLMGIPFNSAETVHGRETDVIEGFRFGGDAANNKFWFVARIKDGVLPESLHYRKREIHYGVAKTASGKWEFHCGAWSSAFIDTKYLPSGCQEPNVGTALGSAWN